MIKRFFWILAIAGLLSQTSSAQIITNSDVPIAPIAPVAYQGWTNAFRLQSTGLEVVVVPDIGRIVCLAPQSGISLLRLEDGLKGRVPDPNPQDSWLNFGGDWFWPVSQARWTDIAGQDWPPPAVLAEQPWIGTAWKGSDGSQYVLISRDYGAPLHLKASRLLKLENGKSCLTLNQKLERTGDSTVPVTLWNISQVAKPDRVLLPVGTNSSFAGGFKVLNFDAPNPSMHSVCEGAVVLEAGAPGEYKLGSDSERGWIAALRGETLLVEYADNKPSDAPYPDGGCRVECYLNAGLGYAEIETLSPERMLQRGECLENTLTLRLFTVPEKLDAEALAREVRQRLEEK